MRRMAYAGVVVAVLAAGLVGLALAGQPGSAARAASVRRVTRAAPRVAITGGSTCYVGVTECSESPCVEFVGAASSAVYVVPGIQPAQPASKCPTGHRRSRPAPAASANLGAPLQAVTAQLARTLSAHQLSSRYP